MSKHAFWFTGLLVLMLAGGALLTRTAPNRFADWQFSSLTHPIRSHSKPNATASATVSIEILASDSEPDISPAAARQIDYVEFIRSDALLVPIAQKFESAFPEITAPELANHIRDHLTVAQESTDVIRLTCTLTPRLLANALLDELLAEMYVPLERALWPQREESGDLRQSVEELTSRIGTLKAEYQNLLETTPFQPPHRPKVLTDKFAELQRTREEYESRITQLAIRSLRSDGLQVSVLEMPRKPTATRQEVAAYERLRQSCDALPELDVVIR